MESHPLTVVPELTAHAIFLGERLELRSFEATRRISSSPLVVSAGVNGYAVLFRYGVAVFFGLSPLEEVNFLEGLRQYVIKPWDKTENEEVQIRLSEKNHDDIDAHQVMLKNYSIERLQLIADVLAKSVVVARYETSIARSFDQIEPLAERLQREGRIGRHGRYLIRHIGDMLSIQSKMVGRAEVAEKPELLWEFPELEGLFLRLEDEFELRERHLALERKLELISRTATAMLDLLHHNQGLRVEWYIVILIVFDIIISLGEKIFMS